MNTEGAETCSLSKFVKFCSDHAAEMNYVSKNIFTIAVIFFWDYPTDLNDVYLRLYKKIDG